MPDMEDIVQLSDDDFSSGDEEVEEVIAIGDPFEDGEYNEIRFSKKLRRGLQYVKSGFVTHMEDTLPDRIHVYKCVVRASMKEKAYSVKAAMSQVSGSIVRCSCACPQSALGRCSHISALLLSILLHKNLNGPAGKLFIFILLKLHMLRIQKKLVLSTFLTRTILVVLCNLKFFSFAHHFILRRSTLLGSHG